MSTSSKINNALDGIGDIWYDHAVSTDACILKVTGGLVKVKLEGVDGRCGIVTFSKQLEQLGAHLCGHITLRQSVARVDLVIVAIHKRHQTVSLPETYD